MTREELFGLPISKLVDLVIEYQQTIAQLHVRVSELEARLPHQEVEPQNRLWSQASEPAANPAPVGSLFPSGGGEVLAVGDSGHSTHRPRSRGRSWSRRLRRALNLDASFSGRYLTVGLVVILIAAVLGFMIVQFGPNFSISLHR
ncbi:MAG: hypothetical protein WCF84_00595 [Anaerolineae bacterium]